MALSDPNSFVAEEVVSELRYNFATKANPDGPSGDIPEPSYEKIKKFRRVMGEIVGKSMEGLPEGKTVNDLSAKEQIEIMGAYLARDDSDEQEAIIKAMSELTHIPRPVLIAVPFRIQQGFLSYLSGLFLIPQTSIGGIDS